VLEFNARFGDPETQAVLPLLESDVIDVMEAVIDGTLHRTPVRWAQSASTCVVLTSKGYPGNYETGAPILGLEKVKAQENLIVFHAGTAVSGDKVVTRGGRVLGVTGLGPTL